MKRLQNKWWLLLMLFASLGYSQTIPRQQINLDEFIQKIAANQEEDHNYDDLYDAMMQFFLNPIELNEATEAELRSLYILSEIQIKNLQAHKAKFGNLLSMYELQTIPEFDIETIETLTPFVKVESRLNHEALTGIFRRATEHFLLLRVENTLEKAKGFTDSSFLGNPLKYYARYRVQHSKDFSAGVIMEKDAGEANWLDYSTFHLQMQRKGKLKNVVLGDYQMQFGQGLIFSAGYTAGKGGETVYTIRRSDLGIRPNNSVIEGGFLRGLAGTFALGKLELSPFISSNLQDANLNTEAEEADQVFSSILISGLHRTENEIQKKGQLRQTDYGANIKFRFKNGHLGFTAVHTWFSDSLKRRAREYANFEFKGKQNLVFGPNFSYSWQNFNFFGEAARSSSGGFGAIGGFVASLSPKVEWATSFRNYQKNFHSFYANALAESSRPINERGMYTGLKFTPKKGLVFSAFYDRFRFPWLRYLVDAPSFGSDYLLRVSVAPTKKWAFYAQYHREQKQKNLPENESPSDFLVNTFRQNLLANFERKLGDNWLMQSRVQYNAFQYAHRTKANGIAFIQDLEGDIGPVQLKSRLAYFYTDNYDSRIYAYENDVLYTVSFPAYYGKGLRAYVVTKWALNKHIDLWLKVARTQLFGVDQISSGLNEISVPHKTDFKIQIRYGL